MASAIISAAKLARSYYYSTTRMLQYNEDAKAAHPRPFNVCNRFETLSSQTRNLLCTNYFKIST